MEVTPTLFRFWRSTLYPVCKKFVKNECGISQKCSRRRIAWKKGSVWKNTSISVTGILTLSFLGSNEEIDNQSTFNDVLSSSPLLEATDVFGNAINSSRSPIFSLLIIIWLRVPIHYPSFLHIQHLQLSGETWWWIRLKLVFLNDSGIFMFWFRLRWFEHLWEIFCSLCSNFWVILFQWSRMISNVVMSLNTLILTIFIWFQLYLFLPATNWQWPRYSIQGQRNLGLMFSSNILSWKGASMKPPPFG